MSQTFDRLDVAKKGYLEAPQLAPLAKTKGVPCSAAARETGGISGGEPNAECWHPLQGIVMGKFRCDDAGKYTFPLRYNARAAALFDEACRRLKLEGKFARD
jgi:hypothetical protein